MISSWWRQSVLHYICLLNLCYEVKNDLYSLHKCLSPLWPYGFGPRSPLLQEKVKDNEVPSLLKGSEVFVLSQQSEAMLYCLFPIQPQWVEVWERAVAAVFHSVIWPSDSVFLWDRMQCMFQFWLHKFFWSSVVALGGYTVEGKLWEVARLHVSAFCMAMVVTKIQLSPPHAWSLPRSLPWLLGSAVWNTMIIQARLFRALMSEKPPCNFPLLLVLQGGHSGLHSTGHIFVSFLSCAVGLPSDTLIYRSFKHACVQVKCYFLDCRFQLVISRGEFRGNPSHRHASDITHFDLFEDRTRSIFWHYLCFLSITFHQVWQKLKTKKISGIRETSVLLLFRRENSSTMTFYNESAYSHHSKSRPLPMWCDTSLRWTYRVRYRPHMCKYFVIK